MYDNEFEEETVSYQEWTHQDRAELKTFTLTYDEFLNVAVDRCNSLLFHHYVAQNQTKYIKERRENLPRDTCMVLKDFGENFAYVTQDEVQGNYWSRKSCTLHPVVIYYKNAEDELEHRSLCFLTDDLKHDVSAVNSFQIKVVNFIKEHLPHIKNIEYVSDGCAGQYKNCYNLNFLCKHYKRFGLRARWIFFATCHGKSPCDGICGLIKREVSKESLRRPPDKQILTVQDVHEFCKSHFPKIETFIVTKEEIDEQRATLDLNIQTVPGTRNFHDFTPVTDKIIACKTISYDRQTSTRFNLLTKKLYNWSSNSFVSFVAAGTWHIGFISESIEDELVAKVSLLRVNSKAIFTSGLKMIYRFLYHMKTFYMKFPRQKKEPQLK